MIIQIIILLIAIPVGLLIAYLARDELIQGRFYFKIISIASFIISISFYIKQSYIIANTSFFILIISAISLMQSHNKKLTGKA